MAWPTHKPPSGIPAKGPGHGGPASNVSAGEGWGGPARGASDKAARSPRKAATKRGKPNEPSGTMTVAEPFSSDHQPPPVPPDEKARRTTLAATREARLEQMKDNLANLALNAESEGTRMNATVHWLNREEGMPTQRSDLYVRRNITDFSDEELAAIAGGDIGDNGTGEAPRSTH